MDEVKDKNTLNKKYFFKLFTNITNFLINLIIIGFVPRILGPKVYGDFNFVQNFFMQFVNIFDQGITKSLYKKISQKPHDTGVISFYLKIYLSVFLFIISFILIINYTGLKKIIFPNQNSLLILLGLIWALFYFIHGILITVVDGYGWTVISEINRVIVRVLGFLFIIILLCLNLLNIITFFIYNYFILIGIIVFSLILLIVKKGHQIKSGWNYTEDNKIIYKEEFNDLVYPLFFSQLIIIISFMIENWMLQKFSGSIEQGYFSFAFKISQVCFLFSGALIPLILREFSIHFGNNDIEKIKILFNKYAVLFFSISAFFSCFIAAQSANVVKIFGGSDYSAALIPVILMSLFSIHQNYDYIAGTIFIASAKTKIIRNLNFFKALIGIIITYFLIAPINLFGLNFGALGYAVKMFAINFIFVNIELLILKKIINIKFFNLFFHQITAIVIFTFLSFVSSILISLIIKNTLLNFIISGIIYSIFSIILNIFIPRLFGLNKNIIRLIFNK